MSDKAENKPPISSEDVPIDVGVFNLTVAWYQSLAAEYGQQFAAEYVSSYLRRLADGIASNLKEQEDEDNK